MECSSKNTEKGTAFLGLSWCPRSDSNGHARLGTGPQPAVYANSTTGAATERIIARNRRESRSGPHAERSVSPYPPASRLVAPKPALLVGGQRCIVLVGEMPELSIGMPSSVGSSRAGNWGKKTCPPNTIWPMGLTWVAPAPSEPGSVTWGSPSNSPAGTIGILLVGQARECSCRDSANDKEQGQRPHTIQLIRVLAGSRQKPAQRQHRRRRLQAAKRPCPSAARRSEVSERVSEDRAWFGLKKDGT